MCFRNVVHSAWANEWYDRNPGDQSTYGWNAHNGMYLRNQYDDDSHHVGIDYQQNNHHTSQTKWNYFSTTRLVLGSSGTYLNCSIGSQCEQSTHRALCSSDNRWCSPEFISNSRGKYCNDCGGFAGESAWGEQSKQDKLSWCRKHTAWINYSPSCSFSFHNHLYLSLFLE